MNTTMTDESKSPVSRFNAITRDQRRRRWTAAEKARLVEATMRRGMSYSYVARQAGLAPSRLVVWKRLLAEGGRAAIEADEVAGGVSKVRELEMRVRDLERLFGRKTMEAEIFKETL